MNPGADESLARTTRIRILALVSLLVALMAVGMLSLRNLKHTTDEEGQALLLLLEIDRFARALRDAEIGQRDYLLTGDEGGLARFEAAAAELELRGEEVAAIGSEQESFAEDVEQFRESTQARLVELRRAVTMRKERGLVEAAAFVAAFEASDSARSVRELKMAARDDIESRTQERSLEVEQSYRVAMINLAIGGLLGIVVLGFLMLAMSRSLRRERINSRELEDQRELLRATLTGIDGVVVTTAEDGQVRYTNELGEQVFTREQLEEFGQLVHAEAAGPGSADAPQALRHLADANGASRTFESRTTVMRGPTGESAGAVTVLRDVSEVRRLQRAVTDSEALKTAILDTAFDCIITIDGDGRVIEFNPAACRTFGYERAEVIGRPMAGLIIPPDQRAACAEGMRRYDATGTSELLGRQAELIAMRSDGTEFPVEAFISEITFEGRKCFTSYLRDITGRRRLEEAREVQMRLLALAADIGSALSRPGTLPQVLNDCASSLAAQLDATVVQVWLLDRSGERVVRHGTAGSGRRDAPESEELDGGSWIAKVVRTGGAIAVPANQWDHETPDAGEPAAAGDVVCYPIVLDEQSIGVVVAFVDGESPISPTEAIASVATEVALGIERLRSEERVADLLEVEKVRADRLEQISAAAATIHAATTESDVIQVVQAEARRILEGERAEISLGTEPPEPIPNQLSAPLRGRDGRSVGHLRLIASRRSDFDRLDLFLLRQLSSMAAVALDNARLYAELREGAKRKDEFIATLAHELRNPLAPIRNALRIMERSKEDPAMVSTYRETAERQVRHLARLVDDLLDISRIDRGKLSLRRRRVSLRRLVESAVEASRPTVEESAHELVVTLPDREVTLHADEDRIVQVLLNLLNNAAKFTERGGRIELEVRIEAESARVIVRDNGIGISEQALTRIFELFAQADRRSDTGPGGLGVGLSLVRRLVEMHGGSVTARSEGPGRGSEFTITLPVVDAASSGDDSENPVDTGDSVTVETGEAVGEDERRRVVVVDDQRDSADTLATLLRMMGHEVTTAYDGEAAVERARELRPDLVILDIGLPGISGYEAAQRIRSLPDGEAVYLVALTGWGQKSARRQSGEAGFDRHLVKPLQPSALDEVLASLPRRAPDRPDTGRREAEE